MKVVMLANAAGPKGVFLKGSRHEMSKEVADPIIKGGYAKEWNATDFREIHPQETAEKKRR